MHFRELLRGIWNGPFYVGPLVKPVSGPEVVLKLLETTWKAFFILFLAVAVVGALIGVDALTSGSREADDFSDLAADLNATIDAPEADLNRALEPWADYKNGPIVDDAP